MAIKQSILVLVKQSSIKVIYHMLLHKAIIALAMVIMTTPGWAEVNLSTWCQPEYDMGLNEKIDALRQSANNWHKVNEDLKTASKKESDKGNTQEAVRIDRVGLHSRLHETETLLQMQALQLQNLEGFVNQMFDCQSKKQKR